MIGTMTPEHSPMRWWRPVCPADGAFMQRFGKFYHCMTCHFCVQQLPKSDGGGLRVAPLSEIPNSPRPPAVMRQCELCPRMLTQGYSWIRGRWRLHSRKVCHMHRKNKRRQVD
jgi:hypothetical protein